MADVSKLATIATRSPPAPKRNAEFTYHAGADDLLHARVGVEIRLARECQPAVEPGLRQQCLGLVSLLVQQHVYASLVQ
jgi:hypothetical protein